jgi:hypothetical protein
MQCPKCNTLGTSQDRNCIRCGARLSSGNRKLPGIVGTCFAVAMMFLLVAARPIPPATFKDGLAWSLTCGLFCGVAGVVGTFFGWVVQKVTS